MKTILVTGGASGLGFIITSSLLELGYKVCFTYHNSIESATSLESKGAKKIYVDFTDHKTIDDCKKVIQTSNIDVLINNAITFYKQERFHKVVQEDFVKGFRHNILPWIELTKACVLVFKKRKTGKIINILSNAIINNPPLGYAQYTAEKAYLASLSKSWAIEYGKYGITSNSISPSFMKTGLHKTLDVRIIEGMEQSHPIKKLLNPNDLVSPIRFLIEAPLHINGINMPINSIEKIMS